MSDDFSMNPGAVRNKAISLLVLVMLIACISAGFLVIAQRALAEPSSTSDENTWVTDGMVNAVATSGSTTYIGGMFTQVGPRTWRDLGMREISNLGNPGPAPSCLILEIHNIKSQQGFNNRRFM